MLDPYLPCNDPPDSHINIPSLFRDAIVLVLSNGLQISYLYDFRLVSLTLMDGGGGYLQVFIQLQDAFGSYKILRGAQHVTGTLKS